MDYLPPTSAETPPSTIMHRQTISDTELTGAKGIGEGGTMGAPAAVLSAIADALDHLGAEVFHMPQSPHRLQPTIAAARPPATAPGRAAGSGGPKGEKGGRTGPY